MKIRRARKLLHGALLTAAITGCATGVPSDEEPGDDRSNTDDIAQALARLPEATVLLYSPDGIPQHIVGDLGKSSAQQDDMRIADARLRPDLEPLLKAFRLDPGALSLRKMNVDDGGARHFRYGQKFNGLDVIGSELVVRVDVKGGLAAASGTSRGDIRGDLGAAAISRGAADAAIAGDARFVGMRVTGSRMVYIHTPDGPTYKAYEQIVEGKRGQDPARDKVYVDVETGNVVAVHPTYHFALNRRVHSANNGTSLPGTLRRSEGQAATTDVDVNAAYDNSGATYQGYNFFFGRDSYNNAGATLLSTVHFDSNYCNAFWDGTQMVYGDGSAADNCGPLARSLDVAAHELTHAVTENESNLIYANESGGLNESYSDIFGAFIEAYVDGGSNGTLSTGADVFLIGDEVLPPFLRSMCDPAADGASRDEWTAGMGSADVHFTSGPNNLVFCLLTKGGKHPRGKTNVMVPAIGMEKAARIFYKANVDILTPSSNYAAMRTAALSAAQQLGMDQPTIDAVGCAYAAIKVGTAPATCGGGNPNPTDGVLANGVPQSGLSDSVAKNLKFWKIDVPAGQSTLTIAINGGSGDADLYVNFGAKPTTSTWQCRPYKSGNTETCTFTPPSAGTYWVGVHAYSAYSGLTLTGTFSGTSGGDPFLTNGTAVTGLSGAKDNSKFFRVAVPSGKNLSVRLSGGSGDADLYTRFGARPTTSTYACRPFLGGNTETCTHNNASAGDWYVMIRGFSAYSGAQIIASF